MDISSEPRDTPQRSVSSRCEIDSLRELQLVDWQRGDWTPIEQICANQFAHLRLTEDEYLELILAERDLRIRLGDSPTVTEYVARFPMLQDRLHSLFALAFELDDMGEVDSAQKASMEQDTHSCSLSENPSQVDSKLTLAQTVERDAGLHQGSLTTAAQPAKIGKYRLEERLGQGGMGTVFRASHSLIDHHVALKLMLPQLVGHPSLQKRFLKEAQVCVGLHHPNIVRTFDIDEDNGRLYLTMELLTGCHLAQRVAQQGTLSSLETAQIICQAASGLAYAHSLGVIHRDVKPQNLMLTDDGQLKVLDLGLASLLGDYGADTSSSQVRGNESQWVKALQHSTDDLITEDGRLTYVGTILGTLGYMAPEQAINPGLPDARNDVFSLGCTAFYLLTSQSIHGQRAPREVLKRLTSDQRWIDSPLEGVCEKWKKLLEKMIAWKAEDRFDSMQEVKAAIEATFQLGRPWKPDPNDLPQLKQKLVELQLVTEEQLYFAENSYDDLATTGYAATLGPSWNVQSNRVPTLALQFLFKLAQTSQSANGETLLTQYQVQQILAGHAGTLRQGKWLIRESLNRGWKGELFLALDTESNCKVSLRVLHRSRLLGLGETQQLEIAVHQMAQRVLPLQYPNLAKVSSFEMRGDWLVIASEYLNGETLRKSLLRASSAGSLLDFVTMVQMAIELATGVQLLHESGCQHLDLSPDRWIKRKQGPWCLLDAGCAPLLLSKSWSDMPQSAGLPPVVPPELVQNLANAGSRTDIYALGCVFRFLTTGNFPFQSIKLSELERPLLPTAGGSVLPTRSREQLKLPRLRSPRTENEEGDSRFQWNRLVDSMTHADPFCRPATVEHVVRSLHQIIDKAGAEHPGDAILLEDATRQDEGVKSIDGMGRSFPQRLRRLFRRGH